MFNRRMAAFGKMTNLARRRPLWLSLVLFLCLIYLGVMMSLFAARAVMPHWPSWLALLNVFAPFLFAPLLIILPVALWARSKTVFMASLVAAALGFLLYGSRFLTEPPANAAANGVMTVMTFNLGPNQALPEQNLAAIEAENADIVTVQELVPATVKLLRASLADRYPYMILDLRADTTGLLSRYPIINSDWFSPAGRGRSVLHATLNVNGTPLHILAVHPLPPGISWHDEYPLPTGLDDAEQELEAKDILRRVTYLEGPVLVMGDFNMSDQSSVYNLVSSALEDSYRQVGWGLGFTFPNHLKMQGMPVPGPFIRIDYVFHSAHTSAQSARVSCEGGSDHCYLVVKLTKN